MYNNQHAGPAFLEFLDSIGKMSCAKISISSFTRYTCSHTRLMCYATGQRIRLRGFEGYKAGLDTRTDSTGTHAVAATYRGAEVTFHVSTMLPFTPNNRQQLLRKRHIGNDIVTIVFQVNRVYLSEFVSYDRLSVICAVCTWHNRNLARYRSVLEGYGRSFNTCSSWSELLIRVRTTLSTR